jgi:hypothetical protein
MDRRGLMPDVMNGMRVALLQIFEMVERLFPIKEPDVLGLGRGESSYRPTQVNEMRLDRRVHRVHPDLAGQIVRLPRIARTARRHDVGPVVRAAARERDQVIARQGFTRLELDLKAAAVLAAVAIARKEKGVRHLAAETTGDVNEAREANDHWTRKRQSLGPNDAIGVSLDDLGLSINHQPQGAAQRNHRQRFKRSIQCQTTNDQALLLGKPTKIYNWYTTAINTTPAVAGNSLCSRETSLAGPLNSIGE